MFAGLRVQYAHAETIVCLRRLGAMSLQGAVAVVTGASRGIGKAVAVALAGEGASVVCAARSTAEMPSRAPGTIDETVRQIRATGGRAVAVPCDLLVDQQVEALAKATVAEFGRVDILVNNAGYLYRSPFVELPMKRWGLMLGVNLRGTALCTKVFLPHMLAQGSGRILNVSSGAAASSLAMAEVDAKLGTLAYSIAKAGIERLTEGLALELQGTGVAVNCLRVDLLIAAEGAMEGNADIDYGIAEPPKRAAEAMLWLLSRPVTYTGRVVSMSDIRQWKHLKIFD